MRIFLFVLFMFSIGTVKSQSGVDTITISDPIKFKSIPTCFGENCQSGKSCSPITSGTSASGYVHYSEVRIGKIKHCKMICQTINGICTRTMILVHNAEGVSQAGKQAGKQFGEPTYTKEGSLYVYSWNHIPNKEKELNARLEVAADLQSAKLFVE